MPNYTLNLPDPGEGFVVLAELQPAHIGDKIWDTYCGRWMVVEELLGGKTATDKKHIVAGRIPPPEPTGLDFIATVLKPGQMIVCWNGCTFYRVDCGLVDDSGEMVALSNRSGWEWSSHPIPYFSAKNCTIYPPEEKPSEAKVGGDEIILLYANCGDCRHWRDPLGCSIGVKYEMGTRCPVTRTKNGIGEPWAGQP